MSDEEILRSSGLIMRDEAQNREGLTLAGGLLFGKDTTIMAALPHHKTDMLLRVENLDRYDDRDVIITNLIESYDRMMAFCQKHLSDPFVMEGTQSISARDKILREICSNSLAHRNYSSGYVSKLVIEKDRIYTENPNISRNSGILELSSFKPFPKNPPISKVFREIGLSDELGSGMRNTYKYTELYSGGTPEFVEDGDTFCTVISLSSVAVFRLGPSTPQVTMQVTPQATPQVTELQRKIISFCHEPRSKKEIMEFCKLRDRNNFSKVYLRPLLEDGLLRMTIPDKPNSNRQKYVFS